MMLQNLKHTVPMVYGYYSDQFYGGTIWAVPMQGIRQRNSASPMLWVDVSTPILSSKCFACHPLAWFLMQVSVARLLGLLASSVEDTDLI